MKEFIRGIIETGNYVLSEMEERIEKMYVLGKISEEDMTELLALASERANDNLQIDIAAMLADLDARVSALEAKGVVVWTAGHITAKGETVLYDVDNDVVLDYCRYDGGRATTSSSPGKITGWVKTDANGNVTHTIEKDSNGNIIIVPISVSSESEGE